MGQVLIDTAELRDVARVFRSEASGLAEVSLDLARGRAQTPPPPGQLNAIAVRAISVESRIRSIGSQFCDTAAMLEREAAAVDAEQARIVSLVPGATNWPSFSSCLVRGEPGRPNAGATGGGGSSQDFLDRMGGFAEDLDTRLEWITAFITQSVRGYTTGAGKVVADYPRYARGFAPWMNKLGTARQLRLLGGVVTIGVAGLAQGIEDRDRDFSPNQKTARIAAAGILEGGGAIGGAFLLAPLLPPLGSLVGGYLGGKVGGLAKRTLFDIADRFQDNRFLNPLRLPSLFGGR